MTKPVVVLHRRRHRAAGQEDGPRRRDRLGRQGHRRGQDGGAARRRRQGRAQPDRGRRADGRGRRQALSVADGDRRRRVSRRRQRAPARLRASRRSATIGCELAGRSETPRMTLAGSPLSLLVAERRSASCLTGRGTGRR